MEDDVFRLSFEKALERKDELMTKRQLISVSFSIFDIIGGLAPVVFFLKCLFQRVCKEVGLWEDDLSPEIKKEWNKWISGDEKCRDCSLTKLLRITGLCQKFIKECKRKKY